MAIYTCRRCEHTQEIAWEAECPSCKGFYKARRLGIDRGKKRITAADAVDVEIKRVATGIPQFDDLLTGGIVRGFAALFGGPRGSGKTTLMMQMLDSFSRKHDCPVLFASKEEYSKFVLATLNRLGIVNNRIGVLGAGEVEDVRGVLERCKEDGVKFAVFDSLQAIGYDDMPDSSARDKIVAHEITEYCKKSNMFGVMMAHMNKALEMVGSTRVGHDVDVELEIHEFNEKDDGRAHRIFTDEDLARIKLKDVRTLICGKNRGGEKGKKMFWLIGERGLEPLEACAEKPLLEKGKPRKTTLKLVTEESSSEDVPTP
jgi:DNA repair protein RadA/Sms